MPGMAHRPNPRAKLPLPIKLAVAVGVVVALGFLFVRSVRDTRATPYTVDRELLRNWTLASERTASPNEPMLVLRPPPALVSGLFNQIFLRAMVSLVSPSQPGIPLLLQSEFDRAFAGRVTPEALLATARGAGLEAATLVPRCLAYRRVGEPPPGAQVYFMIMEEPAFARFREQAAALLGGAHAADFDPAALSPVLFLAASEPPFSRWLPLVANPQTDCLAPIK